MHEFLMEPMFFTIHITILLPIVFGHFLYYRLVQKYTLDPFQMHTFEFLQLLHDLSIFIQWHFLMVSASLL